MDEDGLKEMLADSVKSKFPHLVEPIQNAIYLAHENQTQVAVKIAMVILNDVNFTMLFPFSEDVSTGKSILTLIDFSSNKIVWAVLAITKGYIGVYRVGVRFINNGSTEFFNIHDLKPFEEKQEIEDLSGTKLFSFMLVRSKGFFDMIDSIPQEMRNIDANEELLSLLAQISL